MRTFLVDEYYTRFFYKTLKVPVATTNTTESVFIQNQPPVTARRCAHCAANKEISASWDKQNGDRRCRGHVLRAPPVDTACLHLTAREMKSSGSCYLPQVPSLQNISNYPDFPCGNLKSRADLKTPRTILMAPFWPCADGRI